MTNHNPSPTNKRRKLPTIIFLLGFIILSTFVLMKMSFIREFFGFNSEFTINLHKIMNYLFIFTGISLGSIIFLYIILKLYNTLPLREKILEQDLIQQKKLFFPHFRATYVLNVKGLPRKDINERKNESLIDETFVSKNWDVITGIAKVCGEISYWIIKSKNNIKIYFTISGWSWFSKEKANTKASNGALSLKAAFTNKYPTIRFEKAGPQDIKVLFDVIEKCHYGLSTKGVPAFKMYQAQIDRLINTFSSNNEDCYYVVALSGIKKGNERKQITKNLRNKDFKTELEEDFIESKKSGQSKIGTYAFSQTEEGMYAILAAILSIWSGTLTFNVEKLGKNKNKEIYNSNLKLFPMKRNRLSNKVISNLIHLPEKPYLTEDTGQPIFEIPSSTYEKEKRNIVIGDIIQNDKLLDEYSLPLENMLFNTEIVGMIGRGKSYLVASIIEQLLDVDLGCLIFDLKGEYSSFFINNPNTIVYTIGEPAPLGINLFEINSNDEVQNVLALICEMLTIAGSPFSPTMLNIFESALQKISLEKEKNLERFMLCLYESSEEYSSNMKTTYSRDSIDAILNRLSYIFGGVNYEVFSVVKSTLDFTQLDNGKKIILDFSEYLRRGASTASLFLVCNLILHLLSKHASEKGITNELRYLVILEEAMYLIPKRYNLESSASIGYSEQNFIMGRSLGIGTITIFQLWDSVSSVVHANSLTKILFRGEDVEKIKGTLNLTDEQFDYLPLLPDRNFIIKSKSVSGPTLLKTKTFERESYIKNQYRDIARKKFLKEGLLYEKLSKTLIDLRKEIFEKKTIVKETPKITTNERNIKMELVNNSTNFDENFWEWCINLCPTRLEFKDKNSNWIKKNICKDLQIKANNISNNLLLDNPASLFEIINNNPEYLVQRILKYYINDCNIKHPKLLAFCTVNQLLHKLKDKYNFSNSWKNNSLIKIKKALNNTSITGYSIF